MAHVGGVVDGGACAGRGGAQGQVERACGGERSGSGASNMSRPAAVGDRGLQRSKRAACCGRTACLSQEKLQEAWPVPQRLRTPASGRLPDIDVGYKSRLRCPQRQRATQAGISQHFGCILAAEDPFLPKKSRRRAYEQRQRLGGVSGSRQRSPQVYQVICLLPGPAAGTNGTLRSTRLLYNTSWGAGAAPLAQLPHGGCHTRSMSASTTEPTN